MKALALALVLLAPVIAAGGDQSQVEELPELAAPVNDFAGVIDARSKSEIEALIRKVQGATSDVIVVATVKTFKPYGDMPSYAVKMFENHGKGIGVKGKDNGVLILLALDDRQVRIEPGYGLEGFITDGFAGETSRAMVPSFQQGNYGAGLLLGTTRVAQRIAEGRNVDLGLGREQTQRRQREGGRFPIGFWVVLAIIILNMMGRGKRRRRRWHSGVGPFGGGFGGGFGGHRGGFGGGGFGGGGFGGFGGGRSGGGGGGASW